MLLLTLLGAVGDSGVSSRFDGLSVSSSVSGLVGSMQPVFDRPALGLVPSETAAGVLPWFSTFPVGGWFCSWIQSGAQAAAAWVTAFHATQCLFACWHLAMVCGCLLAGVGCLVAAKAKKVFVRLTCTVQKVGRFGFQRNTGRCRVVGRQRKCVPRKGWKRRMHLRVHGFAPPFLARTARGFLGLSLRHGSHFLNLFKKIFYWDVHVAANHKFTKVSRSFNGRGGTWSNTQSGSDFLRGGAGGSARTRRVQTENRLLEGLKELLAQHGRSESKTEDPGSRLLKELQKLVQQAPDVTQLISSLEKLVRNTKEELAKEPGANVDKSNKIPKHGSKKQSFYGDFWARAKVDDLTLTLKLTKGKIGKLTPFRACLLSLLVNGLEVFGTPKRRSILKKCFLVWKKGKNQGERCFLLLLTRHVFFNNWLLAIR